MLDDHALPVLALAALHVGARWALPDATTPKAAHTRWCAIHAVVNLALCALAWPDLVAVARDPVRRALDPPTSTQPVALALWLHLYHSVCYALSVDDAAHHLLFALLLGLPSYAHARRITNAMLFFLSGLPGALLYALVALRRVGIGRGIDEPRVSLLVNAGLRAPGILGGVLCVLAQPHAAGVPRPVLAMQIALPTLNAVYYTHQSWRRVRRRA
jgi:hypothetical protein